MNLPRPLTRQGRARQPHRGGPAWAVLTWTLRVAGAGLLAAMGAIHLHLYLIGYREIPTIGVLFLVNAVLGIAGCLVLLAVPRSWLSLTCAGGMLLAAGTIAGLLFSHYHGLFGFVETLQAPYVTSALVIESAAVVILGALGFFERPAWVRPGRR